MSAAENREFEGKAKMVMSATALLAIGASFAFGVSLLNSSERQDMQTWGLLGDFIGGFVGTIVAAGAFAALIVTIGMQQRLLRIARRQLISTREEMQLSTATLALQGFESTFFRMLARLDTLVEAQQLLVMVPETNKFGVSIKVPSKKIGREAMSAMSFRVFEEILLTGSVERRVAVARKQYEDVYDQAKATLGPYFRTLFHTIKQIDNSDLPEDVKVSYANVLRAQLSVLELALIFLNVLGGEGEGLRPYVEYYGMLKHLDRDKDLPGGIGRLQNAIAGSAFEDSATRITNAYGLPAALRENRERAARAKASIRQLSK